MLGRRMVCSTSAGSVVGWVVASVAVGLVLDDKLIATAVC
jgi:hypothetical protein